MSNVHGLFSGNNKKDSDDEDKDDSNNRYVGGIGARGGGRYDTIRYDCFVLLALSAILWQWRLLLLLLLLLLASKDLFSYCLFLSFFIYV